MYEERFTFGKHKGERISTVASSYLKWVFANCENIDHHLRAAIYAELRSRESNAEPSPRQRSGTLVDIASVIRKWHAEMALAFHPDRGGSNEAMRAINHAADRLREMVAA